MSRKARESVPGVRNCKICSRLACIAFLEKDYCLIHFHTHVSQKQTKEIRPLVISNEIIERQSDGYKLMAKEAMTEVIMQMMELQRQEQEEIRLDPLSVLEMHAPRLQSNQLSLKRRVSVEGKPIDKKSLKLSSSSDTSSSRSANADFHFTGLKCTKCGSENTTECFTGSATAVEESAGTRGETWGSKDRPVECEGTRNRQTTCQECGYVKIVRIEF